MNRKLGCFRGWDSFAEAANILNLYESLNTRLMDVVHRLVGDDKSSLLGPLKHVGLLYLVGKEQFFSAD